MDTIKKGDKVRALPAAATQIDPKIAFNKRASTLDAFMKDNRISGVLVLKDGEIVLEKYALGRKPEEAIRRSVRGMLPKGPLGRQMIKKLKVYAGPEHPHAAQQPQVLNV